MEALWKSNAFTIADLNTFKYKEDSVPDHPSSTRIYVKSSLLVSPSVVQSLRRLMGIVINSRRDSQTGSLRLRGGLGMSGIYGSTR
jgi:hypothetical protein